MNVVAILADKVYTKTSWGRRILSSLTNQLKAKRIPYCEIHDMCPANCETVFVITSNFEWTRRVVSQLNQSGRVPILLCNQYENLPGCIYNSVSSDVNASMRHLLEILNRDGKRRLAAFGMNPASIADISRVNSLISWKAEIMGEEDSIQIFFNERSLSACLDQFECRASEFDAVICPNDFNAIALVRRLKEKEPKTLERLTIISCAENKLSDYYRKYITTLNVNYEQYGKAAVYIYETLRKNPYLSGMTLQVAWSIDEDSGNRGLTDTPLSVARMGGLISQNQELMEMQIADRVINTADNIDNAILEGLAQELPLETIAEQCYLAESTVKYRIKRMLSISDVDSREDMAKALARYTKELP